jgi:hypothetical protein
MIAARNIKADMRHACIGVTSPVPQAAERPAVVSRRRGSGYEGEQTDTHIEPWMEAAFYGLTHASETGEPFALISCFMNGEPAALIAATHREGNRTHVLPLFMAVQPGMQFTAHDDESGDEEEDGRGPDHAATKTPPAPR